MQVWLARLASGSFAASSDEGLVRWADQGIARTEPQALMLACNAVQLSGHQIVKHTILLTIMNLVWWPEL